MLNHTSLNETSKSLSDWLDIIKIERAPLYHQITHHIPKGSTAIEIGAGSAWLSALLSQNAHITHMTAIDTDERKLTLAENFFAPNLQASKEKISYATSDFHHLPFIESVSIDVVFVDAALHHTETLNVLLHELHRVLTPNGRIIAIREPILPSFPILRQIKRKNFGKTQIANGDIERTYTQKEWMNYFQKSGFNVSFYPAYAYSKKDIFLSKIPFAWLNGIFYNRKYLVAKKI